MGIAFAIIYFPMLMLVSALVLFVTSKLALQATEFRAARVAEAVAFLSGLFGMAAITFGLALLVPYAPDFRQFTQQIILTLVLPGLVGGSIAFTARRHFLKLPTQSSACANRVGIGAMHATWFLPVSFLFYAFKIA